MSSIKPSDVHQQSPTYYLCLPSDNLCLLSLLSWHQIVTHTPQNLAPILSKSRWHAGTLEAQLSTKNVWKKKINLIRIGGAPSQIGVICSNEIRIKMTQSESI